MPDQDWQAAGARIDTLLAASASAGPVARNRAEELVRIVADLYGAGLERLLDLFYERGLLTGEVLEDVAADDLVASLLLVHGLHPHDAATRIEKALAGGDAVLLEVTPDGVARLRMTAGHGCGSAAATRTVEETIEAAAPEITVVEIVADTEPAAAPVIPVSDLFARLAAKRAAAGTST